MTHAQILTRGAVRAIALACLALAAPLSAETPPAPGTAAPTWPERKCAVFTDAWTRLAPAEGAQTPSPEFRGKIDAFVASGCAAPRDACPGTEADIALADALALIVVQEGMSTTFLPIQCR